MKKYILKSLILNLILSSPAHAYLQAGVLNLKNPQALIKKAEQDGIKFSKTEQRLKKEILTKKSNQKYFNEQVFEGELSNSPDYQSYLYEVYVGLPQIEKAKLLVKSQFSNVVKDRWSEIKNTLINESAVEDYASFEPNLNRRLENILFAPIKKGKDIKTDDYRFRIEDWGFAIVTKDLKKITWKLSISANNDFNKLEPGAELIKIKESGSTKRFESPPFENKVPPAPPINSNDLGDDDF